MLHRILVMPSNASFVVDVARHFITKVSETLAVFTSALTDFGNAEDEKPQIEFYTKDRTAWMHPIEGAEQAKTRPDRFSNNPESKTE
ncbi:hypothetical protein FB446DRAFT_419935 [Lentinula raphanica]|nr:hypothetical protein FB446DRAFT_419935 [Lentinula raphanica]